MEDINSAVRKQGALRGVLFGLIMLAIDILKLYYLAYWAKSPINTFIILYPVYYIVLFGIALFFISGLRNKIGRYWTLKQAITGIFILLFVSSVIWNNGLTLFSAKINPDVAQKAHVGFVETRRAAMLSQKQPVEKINKEVKNMNENFSAGSHMTVASFFSSLFISIILVFAVSALLGVLFKRERVVSQ
ncbi:DUF4199 domain-containing protein [Mucilaginibacter galii]|uniref:DUF4199 domain-containing protein n=1 Tax=Mucilaginibacter galii TaxID=2005073 RepID=A0A917J643_9SPHI|nr:DUF4199 domain-containing protein [Mucilaginibacter galii]GGI49216.1 hypothetical protein GCM10011425_04280 [Mucilaginibacter galii]